MDAFSYIMTNVKNLPTIFRSGPLTKVLNPTPPNQRKTLQKQLENKKAR